MRIVDAVDLPLEALENSRKTQKVIRKIPPEAIANCAGLAVSPHLALSVGTCKVVTLEHVFVYSLLFIFTSDTLLGIDLHCDANGVYDFRSGGKWDRCCEIGGWM